MSSRYVHRGFSNVLRAIGVLAVIGGCVLLVTASGADRIAAPAAIALGLALITTADAAFFVSLSDGQLTCRNAWRKEMVALDGTWTLELNPAMSPGVPVLRSGRRKVVLLALTHRFSTFGSLDGREEFLTEIENYLALKR